MIIAGTLAGFSMSRCVIDVDAGRDVGGTRIVEIKAPHSGYIRGLRLGEEMVVHCDDTWTMRYRPSVVRNGEIL